MALLMFLTLLISQQAANATLTGKNQSAEPIGNQVH